MYEKQIQELKDSMDNEILKTHVGARYCDMDKDCPKYREVQITDHYICPYCKWGLETLEGYNPTK